MTAKIIIGDLVWFTANPANTAPDQAIRHVPDGAIAVDDNGKIVFAGEKSALPQEFKTLPTEDHSGKLIMPGFVDAHLHFPQYRMLAAYGKDLLDWLNRYTFIEEQRYGERAIAETAASFFLDELIRNGTTSCLAFSTIHPIALDCLFEAAATRNMGVISGKTMMDRQAPHALLDTSQTGYDESKALIEKWHGPIVKQGNSRNRYAITPRFAVTSSEAQLEAAGTLCREYPELIMQTHLSESAGEIDAVKADFPWSKDYTDVYDRFGLLGPNSIFAHGIHLSERELARLSEAGSTIAHCPTSNNFLGSGLFRFKDTAKAGLSIAMGSDIGGGTSYSMLATMRDAYIVSQLVGNRISAFDAFYTATLGNARIVGLEAETGTLEPGRYADIIALDPEATPLMAERHALSETLHDVLFQLLMMGDDRTIAQTWVAGNPMKS